MGYLLKKDCNFERKMLKCAQKGSQLPQTYEKYKTFLSKFPSLMDGKTVKYYLDILG